MKCDFGVQNRMKCDFGAQYSLMEGIKCGFGVQYSLLEGNEMLLLLVVHPAVDDVSDVHHCNDTRAHSELSGTSGSFSLSAWEHSGVILDHLG